jgi:hypothetical protein
MAFILLSVTDLLREAMEQNPPRKFNGHSASQTILRISGNQKAHYCTHKKRTSLTVIPSRKCRPHSENISFKNHFNIIPFSAVLTPNFLLGFPV